MPLGATTMPWLAHSSRRHWTFALSLGQEYSKTRRYFISLPKLPKLPNLPQLLKPLSSSKQYKDRKLVKYSQQEFYDVVANVDDYKNFLPWCTHSQMSPAPKENIITTPRTGSAPKVIVRHGELGIGFNSLQERYVSTVTCQEPWMVKAVSYDSKLFKELSTTWRFTPNVPKTTTLDAGMDQDAQETQLLTKLLPPTFEPTPVVVDEPEQEQEPEPEPEPPRPHFTAAAVFGEAALPPNITRPTPVLARKPIPSRRSKPATSAITSPPVQVVQRTSSPSNLGTMKPSDYPSCIVDFEIQFEFASPVHASMSSLFFDQVSKEMMVAFIKRAEELHGKR